MHALIVGASGATGADLLDLLLKDEAIQQVDVFVRRQLGKQHPKLKTIIIDFDKPEQWRHLVKGDVLYSALGTTLKAAGSKQAQWKIDYDYQYEFAKAARENQVPAYVLVSSAFASPGAAFYYPKMKGQLEEAVKTLGFRRLAIFKPPSLIRKNSDRGAEQFGVKVLQLLNKAGLFRAQRPLPTQVLAQAMINAAKEGRAGVSVYEPQDIWTLAKPHVL